MTSNKVKFATGDWFQGNGYEKFPGGEKFEGDFKNGKPNGRGVFTKPDEFKIDGEFVDGNAHGEVLPLKTDLKESALWDTQMGIHMKGISRMTRETEEESTDAQMVKFTMENT